MITGITIRNFKGIREIVNLPLSRFHVLVGSNGSGKSTFLSAINFVHDCVVSSPREAVEKRHIADLKDLTWMRKGGAIEIDIHMDLARQLPALEGSRLSYRLAIDQTAELGLIVKEEELRHLKSNGDWKTLLFKDGPGAFFTEHDGHVHPHIHGVEALALSRIPSNGENDYPMTKLARHFLIHGVRCLQINSRAMRLPCPATAPTILMRDGSNLPRIIGNLLGKPEGWGPHWAQPDSQLAMWIDHLRYVPLDIENIGWGRMPPDNREYLMLRYKNGLETPNWLISDGTLRAMALTIPAFLPPEPAIYMVEEPENGVHPKALEIILQSLSLIPKSQTLLTTHSPLVVQQCGAESLLCFSQGNSGVRVVPGPKHPMLENWDGSLEIENVFVAGVLE